MTDRIRSQIGNGAAGACAGVNLLGPSCIDKTSSEDPGGGLRQVINKTGYDHGPPAADGSTDAEVIAESLAEPGRFGVLYTRHAEVLHGYAYRRLGREVAEDVVAETFLRAFRARRTYDHRHDDARPWLFAIAVREIARHHRVEQARYRTLLRSAHDRGEEELADRVAGGSGRRRSVGSDVAKAACRGARRAFSP